MSAFDYPRLMLTGTATCSPATGNNCRSFPLSIFEPLSGKSVVPPRLFLLKKSKNYDKMKTECKNKGFVISEEPVDNDLHEYVEIAPSMLTDTEKFKEWAYLRLGTKYDTDYIDLYKLCGIDGKRPGYFNYYGSMEFDFRNVKVQSIALKAAESNEEIVTEKNSPPDLKNLFGLELEINEGLTSKAKLVDAASTVSMATQIFWDKLSLKKDSRIVFSGKPCKASLRFAGASRVYNLPPGPPSAHCASGTFFSAIRIEDIQNAYGNDLVRSFEARKLRNQPLIGLQVVFNLFEVKENLDTVIDPMNPLPNEVETKVLVTITPWYDGDLRSISMGRQLNAGIKYLKKCYGEGSIKDFLLNPVIAHVDYEQQYLMLDLMNNIPEDYVPKDPLIPPQPLYPIPGRDDDCYETADIGSLVCRLYDSQKFLGTIPITPDTFSRSDYLSTSGKKVLFLDMKFSALDFKNIFMRERIALYLFNKAGKNVIDSEDKPEDYVMLESEYMIATDQGSLCASQFDDPADGYRCFSGKKEDCQISIYHRGFEYPRPIPITLARCEVKPWNLGIALSNHRTFHFKNGDIVSFPTEKTFNGLYLLYGNIDAPTIERLRNEVCINSLKAWFWYFLMAYYNSYVAVRILPHQNYVKYLNLHLGDSKRDEVDFDVLKREIFNDYDVLYPAMSRIFPFDEESFRNNQDHIHDLMNYDNWEKSSYMPVSRDLSSQQLRLFKEWMKKNNGAYHHSADLGDETLAAEGIVPR